MAHVVFLTLPEAGHLIPTFKLARELGAAAHRVTFLTVPSLLELVRANRFAALAAGVPRDSPVRASVRGMLSRRVSATFRMYDLEDLHRLLVALKPDAVLLDQLLTSTCSGILDRLGILRIAVNVCLPDEREGCVPPVTAHMAPARSMYGRALIELSWLRVFLQRWWRHLISHPFASAPRLSNAGPEIVLCSEAFDFERPKRGARHYIGPSVDLDRAAVPFPWHAIDRRAKLIYCSFGSQSHRYAGMSVLVTRIIEAVAARSDEQLVLAIDRETQRHIRCTAPNVVIVNSAPQLSLIEKASAAILHGGLGGIKECILLGVPMLIFPQDFDQPGNAARVEFHGIGRRCLKRWPTPAQIRGLLDQIQSSVSIRGRLQRMQHRFRQEQAWGVGVEVVEAYLKRPAIGRTALG